jgi:hypothetical protein
VDGVPLIEPTYVAEKARTGPKPVSCYLEHTWGTHWEPEEHHREHKENMWTDHWEHMGTGYEHNQLKKIFLPPPFPREKDKPS